MSASDGHVVICDGMMMRLEKCQKGLPPGGVLIAGSSGTIFRTRSRARRAIRRTVLYAQAQNLTWPIMDATKVTIKVVQEES